MTIRTVVTVALAVAMLGASLPAVDRARVQHADARVTSEVERLERAAEALAATNDPVPSGTTPARRLLTLRLPVQSWGAAGIDRFQVSPPTADADVVWRVQGGTVTARRLSAVRLAGPANGLHLDRGGRHRLRLELRSRENRPIVLVTQPSQRP